MTDSTEPPRAAALRHLLACLEGAAQMIDRALETHMEALHDCTPLTLNERNTIRNRIADIETSLTCLSFELPPTTVQP